MRIESILILIHIGNLEQIQQVISMFNTLRLRQNGRHFPDDIFKCIFLNENVWISIKISLKFVPKGPINNNPALVHIMAWHWPGDKPLSEPIMVKLSTHICVTRPQWVKQHLKVSSIVCMHVQVISMFKKYQTVSSLLCMHVHACKNHWNITQVCLSYSIPDNIFTADDLVK